MTDEQYQNVLRKLSALDSAVDRARNEAGNKGHFLIVLMLLAILWGLSDVAGRLDKVLALLAK